VSQHSQRNALVALAAAAALVLAGWFLSVKLRELGRLQDCALQGRTNCGSMGQP
jgi:hypothetical protein